MRYFLEFAYNGTHYLGWQAQPDTTQTVQETLQTALSTLLRQPTEITGAGRTDTGVHARRMYAHFDHDTDFDRENLMYRLNSFLPRDIAVSRIIPVHDDAHARFDAKERTYEYHIHTQKDVFLENLSWYYFRNLDTERMNQAAQALFRHSDFESFSKTKTDVKTFICRITRAHWERQGERLIFTVTADRFLRNMVRAIVGTLIEVGLGKLSPEGFEQVILERNRTKAGFSAPARGLYLTEVRYAYLSSPDPSG